MSRYISTRDTDGSDNIDVDTELGGKTEWDDILIKHGIKERPQKQLTEDELTSAVAEAKDEMLKNQSPLDNKSYDELSDLEDDFQDDHVLQQYRQQRMKQLKQQQNQPKYGSLIHIGEADYKSEVTEASMKQSVICILFTFSDPQSQLLLSIAEKLASKYNTSKFIKIEAQKAIPNYPTSSCPTILVYKDTNIIKQYIRLDDFGGLKTNIKSVEYVLGKDNVIDVVDIDSMDDPRVKLQNTKLNINNKNGIRSRRTADDATSEDDSDDD